MPRLQAFAVAKICDLASQMPALRYEFHAPRQVPGAYWNSPSHAPRPPEARGLPPDSHIITRYILSTLCGYGYNLRASTIQVRYWARSCEVAACAVGALVRVANRVGTNNIAVAPNARNNALLSLVSIFTCTPSLFTGPWDELAVPRSLGYRHTR